MLKKHNVAPLNLKRHYRKQIKRYSSKIPRERFKMHSQKHFKNAFSLILKLIRDKN
ncbi:MULTISPECIES: hypothetical protein [unclassified Candidatus Tisiphia]|uniref:hypothetical protein n=1 Tax=unclassified Candidatus Tisiphia TaxID=2996318 RepID=UPI00312C9A02